MGQRANAVVKAKLEGRAGGGRVGRRQKEGKLRVAASEEKVSICLLCHGLSPGKVTERSLSPFTGRK